MKNARSHALFLAEWVICLTLAGVFLAAGLAKIGNPAAFALSIHQFGILPTSCVNLVAIYLPWVEIVCAGALVFCPATRPGALWLAIILLAVFCAALASSALRGEVVDCGCFGANGNPTPAWNAIGRNGGLALLALVALTFTRLRHSKSKNLHLM